MAELQLLTALLTMHKSIGDILEAAQQEGGTIDVFEIELAHEIVNAERAQLLARPTPDAPTPTSRKRKGAPPTSDVAASRQSEKKRAWALELYRWNLARQTPPPSRVCPWKEADLRPGGIRRQVAHATLPSLRGALPAHRAVLLQGAGAGRLLSAPRQPFVRVPAGRARTGEELCGQ